MNVYISYNNAGFEAAKENADESLIETKEEFFKAFEHQFNWGRFDWEKGLCESFQVYNHKGEILFDSEVRAA